MRTRLSRCRLWRVRPAIEVLDVPIVPITLHELLQVVFERHAARARMTVAYANAHVLNVAHGDPALRAALRAADLVYCDGEGVRVAAALLGGHLPERMTGADFIWDLARRAADEAASMYWLGGARGVSEGALQRLANDTPTLAIAGTHHGFFAKDGEETTRVIDAINAARPGILMVGMGTPAQEIWVAHHRDRLDVPIVWSIGATADFLVGVQRRGPPLLTRNGFEWLARLVTDPRRMFSRYVVGNPLFIARVLRQRLMR